MTKKRVLFLCSANTARSQMAEALLRKLGGDEFEVQSAGLAPGEEIHPLAQRVMNEIGIDLTDQHPKSLRPFLGRADVDIVIFVCEKNEPNCPIMWPSALTGYSWPFEDPAALAGSDEDRLQKFRSVRNRIEESIRQWLAEQS